MDMVPGGLPAIHRPPINTVSSPRHKVLNLDRQRYEAPNMNAFKRVSEWKMKHL